MTKGTYNVGENVGPTKDGSFRSCLCAMLVFVAICIILLLAAWPWKSHKPLSKEREDLETNQYERIIGEEEKQRTTTKRKPPLKTKKPVHVEEVPTTTEYVTKELEKTTKFIHIVKTTGHAETPLPDILTTEQVLIHTDLTTKHSEIIPINETTKSSEEVYNTTKIIYVHPENSTEDSPTTEYPEEVYNTTKIIYVYSENSTEDSPTTKYSEEIYNATKIIPVTPQDIVNETTTVVSEEAATKIIYIYPKNTTDIPRTEYPEEYTTEEVSTTEEPYKVTKYFEEQYNATKLLKYSETTEDVASTTELYQSTTTLELPTTLIKDKEEVEETTTDASTTFEDSTTEMVTALLIDIRHRNDSTKNSTGEEMEEITTKIYDPVKNATGETILVETTTESRVRSTVITYVKNETKNMTKRLEKLESSTMEPTKETEIFETDGTEIIDYRDVGHRETETVPKEQKHVSTPPPLVRITNFTKPVCQTVGCKRTAARMLTRIKHEADPCEDFYEYACGGDNADNDAHDKWKRISNKLAEIKDSSPAYLRMFKAYYEACVSFHTDFDYELRTQRAKEILQSVSQLYDRIQQIPEEMTLTELLTRLVKYDSSPLFDISVDVNKQTQRFVFQLTLGKKSTLLQEPSIMTKTQKKCFRNMKKYFSHPIVNMTAVYEKYQICQKNHSDYLNTLDKAVELMGGFAHLDSYNKTWHMQNLRTTIEWDILPILEELPTPGIIERNIIAKNFSIIKVSDLNTQFPLIKWDVLLSKLTGKKVDGDQLVHIYFRNYYHMLFQQFQTMQHWQIHNIFLAMFAYELYTNFIAPEMTSLSSDFCLHQTSNLLKEASSTMYLQSWPPNTIKSGLQQLNDTFVHLKTSLEDSINEADWVDEASKESLTTKLKKTKLISNLDPSAWFNQTSFNFKFDIILLNNSAGKYQQYAIALVKRYRQTLYDLWGEEVTAPQNLWWYYVQPFDSIPVTIYPLNIVVAPLGMVLNNPANVPKYISLAKVGYSLAKAIGKHFDPVGLKYDTAVSPDSMFSYSSMEGCVDDKYSVSLSQKHAGHIFSFRLDARLTSNNRIVEDMTIKLISDMSAEVINDPLLPWISDTYSREKVFYIAIAQEHCRNMDLEDHFVHLFESEHLPPDLLLKSFFANSVPFSETFKCPDGSGMNHPMKCPAFPDIPKEYDYSEI